MSFELLNVAITVNTVRDWNDPGTDKLLLYNLHYHDDLSGQDADQRCEWHRQLRRRWTRENPTLVGNGWEPYPISLRSVNWIKWHLSTGELTEVERQSLWIQIRMLEQSIEHHLLANHLFANAKALLFAGLFFSGRAANRWFDKAQALLIREIEEQILSDGGHFELSPMYHAIILEDVLDIINICGVYGVETPDGLRNVVVPMLSWLSKMTHPDGVPAHFNDSVDGIAPTLDSLRDYARRLNICATASTTTATKWYSDSGYICFSTEDIHLIFDAGAVGPQYQPGHGHCDCLSFELSLGTQRVLVNRGISTYNVGEKRHRERCTSSHNTVSIDGWEQSEIWSAFRVGRRATPHSIEVSDRHFSASHDGWQDRGVKHQRQVTVGNNQIEISDRVVGVYAELPTRLASFHFHPSTNVTVDNEIVSFDAGTLTFENSESLIVEEYLYCDGFNRRRPGVVVRVHFDTSLTSRIRYANTFSH